MGCPDVGAWSKPLRRTPPDEAHLPWPLLLAAAALVGVLALGPPRAERASRPLDAELPLWARALRAPAAGR